MSTETTTSLRVSRVINADADLVFRAWTEPEQIQRWLSPEGVTVANVEVDLTVGGRYRIRMTGAEGQRHTAFGVYREIDPPHRLVCTWDWEEDENRVGETLVTVEFKNLGGATEVVVTHELFPNAEVKSGHEEGWTRCLNRLESIFG